MKRIAQDVTTYRLKKVEPFGDERISLVAVYAGERTVIYNDLTGEIWPESEQCEDS